jgi:hypothetical protein
MQLSEFYLEGLYNPSLTCVYYRYFPTYEQDTFSEHLVVSRKYYMRWNMLPPTGRDGLKNVAFQLKNNRNRVNSFGNRNLFQNKNFNDIFITV